MRKILLGILVLGAFAPLSGQADTTQYLFKNAKYSYIQYGLGYSPMFFGNGQTMHGFSGSIIGVVLNDKIALGLDIDGVVKYDPNAIIVLPEITSFAFMSLNIEPLIKPRKVVNFSFPIKIGYGGASHYELMPQGYLSLQNPSFMVVQPGAMAWINLFKPLSLGVGGSYRMAINGNSSTFETFSGFSGFAMLRFKFYTKEFNQKMMERQRLYLQQQAPK